MDTFNTARITSCNNHKPDQNGAFVLYWMQIYKRTTYNFALQRAVELANSLEKPLLIYEGLSATYPWASDRFHRFILEGMNELVEFSKNKNVNYLAYAEPEAGHGNGLLYQLADFSCAIVTDHYPAFIMTEHNQKVSERVSIPYEIVDGNGIIPFSLTDKAPYSAYLFRKIMQRHFVESVSNPPLKHPLQHLKNDTSLDVAEYLPEKWLQYNTVLSDINAFIADLDIDHQVTALSDSQGTMSAAEQRWNNFLNNGLLSYDDDRNDPDADATSHMSPYLHFGKISSHRMVLDALEHQPDKWSIDDITYNKGSKGDFFNGDNNIASFLDELITWRETGFHFCYHEPEYDQLNTLPEWVQKTIHKHRNDSKEFVYSLNEFEQAKTHNDIWNAAQRQLVKEGRIHNYLRMLWGKKIYEWSSSPEEAIDIMIELNNKYALDGRDPNSYSGIFWIVGRFDRAWQERPIHGKLRYMSSDSTRKKLKLDTYLERFNS